MTVAMRLAEASRFHELHAAHDDIATTTSAKVTMTDLSRTLTVILLSMADVTSTRRRKRRAIGVGRGWTIASTNRASVRNASGF